MTNKPKNYSRIPPLMADYLDDDKEVHKIRERQMQIVMWSGAILAVATLVFIVNPFKPIEYKKTAEEVQKCAAISEAIASADAVQERVFDACLRGDWK